MSSEKRKPGHKDLFFNFLDVIFDAEVQNEDDADRYLREVGADPEELAEKGMTLLSKIKGDIRKSYAKDMLAAFQKLASKIVSSSSISEKRSVLSEGKWIADERLQLSFNRKLQRLTDDDLMALDTEEKLLKIWAEFIKDE